MSARLVHFVAYNLLLSSPKGPTILAAGILEVSINSMYSSSSLLLIPVRFPLHLPLVTHMSPNTYTSLQRPTASIDLPGEERVWRVIPNKGEYRSSMSKLGRLPFNMAWPDEKWAFHPTDRVRISAK